MLWPSSWILRCREGIRRHRGGDACHQMLWINGKGIGPDSSFGSAQKRLLILLDSLQISGAMQLSTATDLARLVSSRIELVAFSPYPFQSFSSKEDDETKELCRKSWKKGWSFVAPD